ncbi:MAG: hypothetical protein ACXVJB_14825 [Mucilaginibacter sp.]
MKYCSTILFILLFICAISLDGCAQLIRIIVTGADTTYFIKSKHYQGIIFTASITDHIYPDVIGTVKRYTPDKQGINESEGAISTIWNEVNLYGKSPYAGNLLYNVTPYFSNYKRQYYGYINEQGQKVVHINLLGFTDKQEFEKYCAKWESRYINGRDGYYEHNTAGFSYNLVTKEIVARE